MRRSACDSRPTSRPQSEKTGKKRMRSLHQHHVFSGVVATACVHARLRTAQCFILLTLKSVWRLKLHERTSVSCKPGRCHLLFRALEHTIALNPPISSGRQRFGGDTEAWRNWEVMGQVLSPVLSGTQTLALATSVTLRIIAGQGVTLELCVLYPVI